MPQKVGSALAAAAPVPADASSTAAAADHAASAAATGAQLPLLTQLARCRLLDIAAQSAEHLPGCRPCLLAAGGLSAAVSKMGGGGNRHNTQHTQRFGLGQVSLCESSEHRLRCQCACCWRHVFPKVCLCMTSTNNLLQHTPFHNMCSPRLEPVCCHTG